LTGIGPVVLGILGISLLAPEKFAKATESLGDVAESSAQLFASPLLGLGAGITSVIDPLARVTGVFTDLIGRTTTTTTTKRRDDLAVCVCPSGERLEPVNGSCLGVCPSVGGTSAPGNGNGTTTIGNGNGTTTIGNGNEDTRRGARVQPEPVIEPLPSFDPHQQLYDPMTGAFIG